LQIPMDLPLIRISSREIDQYILPRTDAN
jgi:hypothetical protein